MRKLILIILNLCITVMSQALTVVSTAGGLSTAITTAGGSLSTVTNLTVTGTIDQRDFDTMKSNMPTLTSVDLSGASIASYLTYPANEVPAEAFHLCLHIRIITIPSSVTSIGSRAFYHCLNIESITISPSSLTSI